MAYEGWISYAGVEVVSTARARAYSRGISVMCGCLELAASLGDSPYTTPWDDPAPWWDPARPESADFHGVAGLELVGASASTMTRQWTELLGEGGVPGSTRHASRETQVKGVALAATDAGLSYGLAWLASALKGNACGLDCFGDVLCVYAACPTRPSLAAVGDACGGGTGVPDWSWDPVLGNDLAPGGDALQRTAWNVATIEGPQVTASAKLAGGVAANVQWTFKAGLPGWYGTPRVVVPAGAAPAFQQVIPDYDPWAWMASCPQYRSCLDADPYCQNPPPGPAFAPRPPDPCFPNDPASNPNAYKFSALRRIWHISRGAPEWMEKVPIITINTGSRPTHRLGIRWYDNPGSQPCDGSLDPCHSCNEIDIPWLPAGSVLTLDSRTRRATVDCPGPGGLLEPRLYGPTGGPFTWPKFECSSSMCVEVITDHLYTVADWSMEIAMAYREDAV